MLATERALHALMLGCTPLRRSVVRNSLLELTGAQQVQLFTAARGQQFLSGQQRQGTGNNGFQAGAGYDAHWRDPLAGLQLRTSSYHWMCSQLKSLANELCEGRVVFVLEVRPLQGCLTKANAVYTACMLRGSNSSRVREQCNLGAWFAIWSHLKRAVLCREATI